MADVVSLVTNPAGALGGAIAGGAATLAGRALGDIPGGSELASFALGEVSNLLQGNRNAAGIYNAFLTGVLQDFASAPYITPLWICYIGNVTFSERAGNSIVSDAVPTRGANYYEDMPDKGALQGVVNSSLHKGSHSIPGIGSGLGLMFCQGVTLPSDAVSTLRDTYPSTAGGFIPGLLGGNRQLNEVTISYYENNASFTDFVLRPWMIGNSYRGMTRRFKADIFIESWVKVTPSSPLKMRKRVVLKGASPVSIDSERFTYTDTNDTRQVQFIYDTYVYDADIGTDWLTVEPPRDNSTFLDRLGGLALNVATNLINKQIESLETNLFSIRPQTVPLSQPGGIQDSSQISSQIKTPSSRDITDIPRVPTQPVLTNLKEDTAVPFEIIANKLQKVIPPADDAIGVEQLQNIAATGQVSIPQDDAFIGNLQDRFLGSRVNPPEEDSPSYRPYARPSPARIPSSQDIPGQNSIPFQLKSNRRNDTAADTTIRSQPVSVRRNDSIES